MRFSSHIKPVFLVLYLAFATGCSSIGSLKDELRAAELESGVGELEPVPFFAQEAYQCGPAALAMVLNATGLEVNPSDLVPLVYVSGRRGTFQVELRSASRRHGRISFADHSDFPTLLERLRTGTPVLVLQNLGLTWLPKWHYAVVVGYDAASHQVLLRSGASRLLKAGLKEFIRTWKGGDYWMMTVHVPDFVPEGASAAEFLTEAAGLERAGRLDAALAAYRAASDAWPRNWLAWMGTGNVHYQREEFGLAEQAYRRALEVNPDHPAPFHNLAWSLLRLDRAEEAALYAKKAVALSGADEYSTALRMLGGAR